MVKTYIIKTLLASFLIFLASIGFAQHKFEEEYRIKEIEVPKSALNFIKSSELNTEIKWYLEKSQTGTSVEAKFKIRETWYSVEFDSSGNLQDVEYEIKKNEIPDNTSKNIRSFLDTEFDKSRIKRIQIHYSGKKNLLLDFLKNNNIAKSLNMQYEIILKAKKTDKSYKYEMKFDFEGNFIKKLKFIQRNIDNLEY